MRWRQSTASQRLDERATQPRPEEALAYDYSDMERNAILENRDRHIIGDPESVRQQIDALRADAQPDEIMIVSNIHDPSKRLRSYELVAEAMAS